MDRQVNNIKLLIIIISFLFIPHIIVSCISEPRDTVCCTFHYSTGFRGENRICPRCGFEGEGWKHGREQECKKCDLITVSWGTTIELYNATLEEIDEYKSEQREKQQAKKEAKEVIKEINKPVKKSKTFIGDY